MDLGKSTVAQQLMLSNVYFWRKGGYFDGSSDLKPLLHTWSLAVEEQFYLGYPLLLMLLHRFGRRATFVVLGLLAICSLLVSEFGVHRHPLATFYLLPTRAWELLIGGLICFLPEPTAVKHVVLAALSWVSLVAILAAAWFYTATTPFPGLSVLVPCVATALLIYCNTLRMSLPAAILRTRPLVLVGLISYSVYLWHWPILAYGRYHYGIELPWLFSVIALGASLIVGFLCWRLVETPLRRSNSHSIRKSFVFSTAIASAIALVFLGIVTVTTDGMIARFPTSRFHWLYENQPHAQFELSIEAMHERGPMRMGIDQNDGKAIDWLVWGDSHAMALAPAFAKLDIEKGLRCEIAAKSGTPPVLHVWQLRNGKEGNKLWTDAITAYCMNNEVKRVALIARWSYYLGDFPKTTVIADHSSSENPHGARQALVRGLKTTIEWFNARNIQVFIFVEVPQQDGNPKYEYTKAVLAGHVPVHGTTLQEHREHQSKVSEVLEQLKDEEITIVSFESCVFDESESSILGDREGPFYEDDHHLSPYGAVALIYPLLRNLDSE